MSKTLKILSRPQGNAEEYGRILEHIARKQDEELAGKSIDELQAMLEAED